MRRSQHQNHCWEHSISILGVWVNHVIILKSITRCYQKQSHEGSRPGEAGCIFVGVWLNYMSRHSLLGRFCGSKNITSN